MLSLTIYLVRNQEGKYFRRKGFGGGGESWTEDVSKARVYVGDKLSQARGVVSFFANKHPAYGVPDIVELIATESKVLDEEERVRKTLKERAKRKEESVLRKKRHDLDKAEKALDKAKSDLDKLRNK